MYSCAFVYIDEEEANKMREPKTRRYKPVYI